MKATPTLTIVMSVICILIYAAFLQFHAATASVGEDFLPGIGTAKLIFSPGFFLLALALVAFISERNTIWVYLATSIAAMPICLLLAFFIHDYDFLTTIEIASERSILRSFLVTQYSNRSYAVALYSFFIAFAHSIAASALITGRTSPGPQTCPRY